VLFVKDEDPKGPNYFVVLYPRLKDQDPETTFVRLSEHAVRVQTPLAVDYLLVDHFPAELRAEAFEVGGTAVAVRFYKDGRIVVANSDDALEARVAGKAISAQGPPLPEAANVSWPERSRH
jgi:hypothetical protein